MWSRHSGVRDLGSSAQGLPIQPTVPWTGAARNGEPVCDHGRADSGSRGRVRIDERERETKREIGLVSWGDDRFCPRYEPSCRLRRAALAVASCLLPLAWCLLPGALCDWPPRRLSPLAQIPNNNVSEQPQTQSDRSPVACKEGITGFCISPGLPPAAPSPSHSKMCPIPCLSCHANQ